MVNAKSFGIVVLYSFIILLIVAFIAGQAGLPTFKVGYGVLILAIAVSFSVVISSINDSRVDRERLIYFVLTIAVLFGSFFLLKKYIPELFSIFPKQIQEVFSFRW